MTTWTKNVLKLLYSMTLLLYSMTFLIIRLDIIFRLEEKAFISLNRKFLLNVTTFLCLCILLVMTTYKSKCSYSFWFAICSNYFRCLEVFMVLKIKIIQYYEPDDRNLSVEMDSWVTKIKYVQLLRFWKFDDQFSIINFLWDSWPVHPPNNILKIS